MNATIALVFFLVTLISMITILRLHHDFRWPTSHDVNALYRSRYEIHELGDPLSQFYLSFIL